MISPRAGESTLTDLGERSAFVGGQRIGRARRRRAKTRQHVVRIAPLLIAAALAAVAIGCLTRWLLSSPRFAVTTIEVAGASRLSADQIRAVAAIPDGINIFRVDPDAVVTRLRTLPEIRSAHVVRTLPDRIVLVVDERRPFTLVHAAALHWIDEEGYVLGEEHRAVAPDAPIISGVTEEELAATRRAPGPKTRTGLALIRTLLRQKSTLAAEISEVDVSRDDGPVLYTVDGIEVRLGNDGWDDRLARLEGVLGQVGLSEWRIGVVDLRFRDQVVLKRGGQS